MSDAQLKKPMTAAELWLWWVSAIMAIVTLASASTLISSSGAISFQTNPAVLIVVTAIAGGITSMTFIPAAVLAGIRQGAHAQQSV